MLCNLKKCHFSCLWRILFKLAFIRFYSCFVDCFNNDKGRRMLLGTHLVQWTYMHCVKFQGARAQFAHVPTIFYIKHLVFRNHSTASTHKNRITWLVVRIYPPKFGKSFKLTTLIDFQIDSNMLYNLKNATFLAYGEAFSS